MISTPELETNLATAGRLIHEARAAGADLVLLPEYFCIMGRRDTDKVAVREGDGDGPIQEFLASSARAEGVWLIGGTLPLATTAPDRVRNACLVFDPEGRRVARYDKIHLFGFKRGTEAFDESRTIEPGRTPVKVAVSAHGREFQVGLSVCYDLRFPELYRQFGVVDLLVVPSAFTYTTGLAHWEILLRARAIENQCYVLAAAQGGTHPSGRRTFGHSLLVDPWGKIQTVLPEGEGVVIGTIDPTYLASVRADLPALTHRTLLHS